MIKPKRIEEKPNDRLNEILLSYVEACEQGHLPDRNVLLKSHPEYRDELRLFFSERDRLERLGGVVRQYTANGEANSNGHASASSVFPETVVGQLGDFRLIREVGRGGMGVVYEAEQISLGRRVAVKVLPFASALDPRQLQRFKNEASAAAHLRHENIVSVHAVGCERGVHFFAMQFVEGQSLSALISELRRPSEPTTTGTTVRNMDIVTNQSRRNSEFDWIALLGKQAALALEHAHQTGVVHRDIKPGNLLLDAHRHLWITDFGLAQFSTDSGLTMTGELLGTLRYASPEQTLGRRGIVDHRSDIYSLGATLYELATLRSPFTGGDRHELLRQITEENPPAPRSIVRTIPEGLETILLKCMRKDPSDRYAIAQDLADDLQRFLDRQPVRARPPGLSERLRMLVRRNPTAFVASVISLFAITAASLLIAVLVGAERGRTRAEQRRTQAAYQAEQQRSSEAESRFRLARRAVDELLRISEDELADRVEMSPLRKRILQSSLTFYQEFLGESREHPKAQSELLETKHRVEKILADLEILRASTRIYLLCQSVVIDDLDVTEPQRVQLADLTSRAGAQWIDSFKDIGVKLPAERARRTLEQARANDEELNSILTSSQQKRLRQIGLQSEGASAFRDREVADSMGLTKHQRDQIRLIEEDANLGWLRREIKTQRDSSDANDEPRQRIFRVLTESQAERWREMTGVPIQSSHFSPDHPGFFKPFTNPSDNQSSEVQTQSSDQRL